MISAESFWVGVGLVGQLCFTARMLLQWLVSERRKASVVTSEFWYWSLIGALMLLSYAMYRRDPVFILGQAVGSFVYVRNLMLLRAASNQSNGPDLSAGN